MTLLFVTGLPGSGKSTACSVLASRFGLNVVNVGDLLATDLRNRGISFASRAEIGEVFLRHRSADGILELIESAMDRGAEVFDGVRLAATCDEARKRHLDLSIWNVESRSEQRLERLKSRLLVQIGPGVPIARVLNSYSQYDAESVAVADLANVRLYNNGSLEAFVTAVGQAYLRINDDTFRSRRGE